MKAYPILMVGLSAAVLFAAPLLGQEKCGKEIIHYDPPPGAYKQISPEEARHMKHAASSDEKEVSVTVERVPEKAEDRNKK